MASHPPPAIKVEDDSKDTSHAHDEAYDSDSDYSATLTPSTHSPTTSLYDKEDLELPLATSGIASQPIFQYSFFHTTSHLNLRIVPVDPAHPKPSCATAPEREATFYATNSLFNPHAADVTLHAGPSESGAVCGVVHMRFKFGTYHVGIGDTVTNEAGVRWYNMQRHGVFKGRYWQIKWEGVDGGEGGVYSWKRTHDRGIGASPSLRNKKLVEEKTGQVVALYLTNHLKSWKKVGKLMIYKDLGGDWAMMVLLSILGIVEKQRRKRRAALLTYGGGGAA
jgi:hypothetical protein